MTRRTGPAEVLHAAGLPDAPERLIRWCEVDRPALVLGSAQPASVVDAEAARRAGLEIVRRRSGGSSVVVGPGRLVWADVVLPSGDPLWAADVSESAVWLGRGGTADPEANASAASSLSRRCSAVSSRRKPAARSSWEMNGWKALS